MPVGYWKLLWYSILGKTKIAENIWLWVKTLVPSWTLTWLGLWILILLTMVSLVLNHPRTRLATGTHRNIIFQAQLNWTPFDSSYSLQQKMCNWRVITIYLATRFMYNSVSEVRKGYSFSCLLKGRNASRPLNLVSRYHNPRQTTMDVWWIAKLDQRIPVDWLVVWSIPKIVVNNG